VENPARRDLVGGARFAPWPYLQLLIHQSTDKLLNQMQNQFSDATDSAGSK
jgi:hypothetical protein